MSDINGNIISTEGLNSAVSDNEYYNLDSKNGWSVKYIKTNLEEADVIDFKEKEGKWFSNLIGKSLDFVRGFGPEDQTLQYKVLVLLRKLKLEVLSQDVLTHVLVTTMIKLMLMMGLVYFLCLVVWTLAIKSIIQMLRYSTLVVMTILILVLLFIHTDVTCL